MGWKDVWEVTGLAKLFWKPTPLPMGEASSRSPLTWGKGLMARDAKEMDSSNASSSPFLMLMRPGFLRKLSQAGSQAWLSSLCYREAGCSGEHRNGWSGTLPEVPPLPFLSRITGSLRVKTRTPIMHPNPAPPPFRHHGGRSFITSQKGSPFFVSGHLAPETF